MSLLIYILHVLDKKWNECFPQARRLSGISCRKITVLFQEEESIKGVEAPVRLIPE